MLEQKFSSSRIAKNTLALYLRSAISMLIGLYSSRVLLRVLGIEDFGIYQAVGGMVALFGFLNSTMSVSSQRFLNYEMGKGNTAGVIDVFCMSINIQTIVAVVVCILCEIVGVYALYNFLSIPIDRVDAALWVFHFSIITLFVSIISVPYNAMIIAKEDMKSFAYIDILGAILKLLSVVILDFFVFDSLLLYAVLILLIQILLRFIYAYICRHKYIEAKYRFCWNKSLFFKMLGFSGWTTLSAVTYMVRGQGISVLYNSFYGVVISAAIGIANQVNNAIITLVNNFTTSFNPQITKNYASGDFEHCCRIHISGPKFSFLLISVISAPIILNIDYILTLWLKTVPQYTSLFILLILIESMLRALISTSNTVIRSTGKVKWFEIISSSIQLVFILFAYFSFLISDVIYLPFICVILSVFFLSLYLIYSSCGILKISPIKYFFEVYVRMIIPYFLLMFFAYFFIPRSDTFVGLIIQSIIIVFLVIGVDYVFCLNKKERNFIKKNINSFINKIAWKI